MARPSVRTMREETDSVLKRREILQKSVATGALVTGGTALTGTVAGTRNQENCTLNWGAEVNPNKCGGRGRAIISVDREVINGIDTGEAEPWAKDDFHQKIQVWETSSGSFCALLEYRGEFDAFEGATSPGGGGTLTGDEEGPFEGGFRLSFDGTFAPGNTQTNGSLGTVDQGCGRTTESCDFRSSVDWISDYFTGTSGLSFDWWGTVYHGGDCGTWVNSIEGNCGDIFCE